MIALAIVATAALAQQDASFDAADKYLRESSFSRACDGFTAYLNLVGRMGADRASYCTVLFPVVALNVSAIYEGYHWTAAALFCSENG